MADDIVPSLANTITDLLFELNEKVEGALSEEVSQEEMLKFGYYMLRAKPETDIAQIRISESAARTLELVCTNIQKSYGLVEEAEYVSREIDDILTTTENFTSEKVMVNLGPKGGEMKAQTSRAIRLLGEEKQEIEKSFCGEGNSGAYQRIVALEMPPMDFLWLIQTTGRWVVEDDEFRGRKVGEKQYFDFELDRKGLNLMIEVFSLQYSFFLNSRDNKEIYPNGVPAVTILRMKQTALAYAGIREMIENPALYDETKARLEPEI